MTLLHGARLLLPTGERPGAWLRVDGARVAAIGDAGDEPATAPDEPRLDLRGRWVVPGFVDVHVHGGAGAAFEADSAERARDAIAHHRRHGTTTMVASVLSRPLADMEAACRTLLELVRDGELAGIHLEGPYLHPDRRGAHDPRNLRTPDRAEIASLLRAGDGAVRMVTLAPELPGGLDLVREVTAHGAVAAVGHSDATYAQTHAAIDAGARMATHLCNGMRGIHHREPGPVVAALEREEVTVEVINDGFHVHPGMVRLIARVAGPRLAFVTDAVAFSGLPDGDYVFDGRPVQVRDGAVHLAESGALAGSSLTMAEAVRRAVRDVGLPLADAVAAATTTPAQALGLADVAGTLAPGRRADLVVLDDDLEVVAVMAAGSWVEGPPS
ncbi:MAG TPA: N-acetylglucosamine-6-phosphate deacetylase [Egibacteraceae bacterium]